MIDNAKQFLRLRLGNSGREWRVRRAVQAFTPHGQVAIGPFAGMKYGQKSFCSVLVPKQLGVYEKELWPVIAKCIHVKPKLIIDVGAAEGYYAVGMALACGPAGTRVIAYEMDSSARAELVSQVHSNDVEGQVEICGECTVEHLQAVLEPQALVICDCEGYEHTLMTPQAVPVLRTCALLIELHDQHHANMVEQMTERFSSTHRIEIIESAPRSPADRPPGLALSKADFVHAVHEGRQFGLRWMWGIPLDSAHWL